MTPCPEDREQARELLRRISGIAWDDSDYEKVASALAKARASSAEMRVVDACITRCASAARCFLCDSVNAIAPDDTEPTHEPDCPLVENGFITRDGRRTGAGP